MKNFFFCFYCYCVAFFIAKENLDMKSIICILLFFIFLKSIRANSCDTYQTLRTCDYLNGKSVFYAGNDPWGADRLIEVGNNEAAPSARYSECVRARTKYQCHATFSTCTEDGNTLMPCRNLCQEVVDKCPLKYRGGLSEALCNKLDDEMCSNGFILRIGYLVFAFILAVQ